ncbi:Fungalysin metallopeptidase-domain-containing protein [Geranomyces variabilis]|nr:Fungalysin metallopeptidase-domain-containing protein [Geranomyces variabilis]KAJ3139471.1 hypothetical protein HDU90_008972 [Geranomyces variabilis]
MRNTFATALLVASAASVLAAPAPPQAISLPKGFTRTPHFETHGTAGSAPASLAAIKDDRQAALTYIASQSGVAVSDLEVTDDYTGSNGLRHVYVKRISNGKRITGQTANASIKDGKIYGFGSSIAGAPVASAGFTAGISASAAQAAAEKAYGLVRNEIAPFQRYVETAENVLEPTWAVQVKSPAGDKKNQWLSVDVSVATGKIVRAISWTKDASYTVAEFKSGTPVGNIITVTDPWTSNKGSPKGWHSDGKTSYTVTQGNNAKSYLGKTKATVSGGASNVYNAKYDFTQAASSANNAKAGVTNNFYVSNMMHDLGMAYGFNEAAGNFQAVNFGGQGQGGDAVQISVQDPGGTDNANFATPPDGQQPQMNMYIFTGTPTRDGTMENDIPEHEYGHGISNRLTGGPSNTDCLPDGESGGMGEGWSDYVYIALSRTAQHTRNDDVIMGAWAVDSPAGIRSQPYSTSLSRNTHKYSQLATTSEVHDIGEIWATMWFEVLWNLIDAHGFDENIFNPPSPPTAGNQVALQLYFDSLAIQPCNPTFITARDAIIQADATRYGGKNKCAIWAGFAKRGLGMNAKNNKDDSTVPAECSGGKPTTTVKPPPATTTATTKPTTTKKTTTTTKKTTTKKTTTTAAPQPTEPSDCPWWWPDCDW